MSRRLLLAASVAGALGGCSLTPRPERPALPVPLSWPAGDATLRQSEAALPVLDRAAIFADPRLLALFDAALANNRDVRIAAANIAAARARYRIQRAERLPVLGAGASATYRDNGGDDGRTGSGGGTTASGGNGSFSVDGGVSAFELDLFGRVAALTEAERNRYFATEAAARTTRILLLSDIADAWLRTAADRSLRAIAEQTAANARESVRITRLRLDGGVAPRTDLRQAEQILYAAESDLAEQDSALAQDINLLQLLVGAPVASELLPASIEEVAPRIALPAAGLESTLLLRRPDVVEAEYALRAANADIGAARAALFPRISLTGLLGFASQSLTSLFSGGSFSWSAGGSADYAIFRGGAARAGVALSEAQRDAALAAYERAIQIAFREVADALARAGTIDRQLAADAAARTAAADAYALAALRYRGGIDTFLGSLDAQRSLYGAERQLVATRLLAASNRTTLFRVLGGDATLDATNNGPVETPAR